MKTKAKTKQNKNQYLWNVKIYCLFCNQQNKGAPLNILNQNARQYKKGINM